MTYLSTARKLARNLATLSKSPTPYRDLSERLARRRELTRLRHLPRHTPTTTDLLGPRLSLVDAASFLVQYRTLFLEEQARFESASERPLVIDCGANVGVSCLYWKRLYPAARVIAFEPDAAVFAALTENVRAFGHDASITLLQKAAWTSETELTFWSEGADAGRIATLSAVNGTVTRVPAVRLRDFLTEPVDLLKIDIEGAETDVLLDCADRLGLVQNLSVEYHSFVDRPQRLHELLSVLAAAGFRVQVLTESASRQPLVASRVLLGMDLQLQIYGARPAPASSAI
jgi:FkbM family methyltransferase